MIDHPLSGIEQGSFELLGVYGALHLYARVGGSDLFGTGCVRDRWSGENGEIEQTLKSMLSIDSALNVLMSPVRLVELAIGSGALRHESVQDECTSGSATLSNAFDAVAQHRVTVETATPTDVVLKVTAFPTWHWRVDGQAVVPKLVFPGYYAVRVPTGRHRIEVTHRFDPATLFGLLLAILGPLMISVSSRQTRQRA
jgi:hypothetical protein